MGKKTQEQQPTATPISFVFAKKGEKADTYTPLDVSGSLKAAAERKHEADKAAKEAREAFEMAVAALAHRSKKLPENVAPVVAWSRFTGEPQLTYDANGAMIVRKLDTAPTAKAVKAAAEMPF